MLSAYWPDPARRRCTTRWFISRWLGHFNLWFDRQAERYKSVIAWALDHRYCDDQRWRVASFVGALALPAMGIIPAALVPIQDNSMFSIDLDVPPGSNLEYAKAKAQEVARIARKRPEVAYTYIAMGARGRRRRRGLGVREAAAEGRAVAHRRPTSRRTSDPRSRRSAASRRPSAAGGTPARRRSRSSSRGSRLAS